MEDNAITSWSAMPERSVGHLVSGFSLAVLEQVLMRNHEQQRSFLTGTFRYRYFSIRLHSCFLGGFQGNAQTSVGLLYTISSPAVV